MNLGQRLTALRNYKRITQDQIAEALNVKRARYNAWENSISNPDHIKLGEIARFHGVTVDFLLGLPHPQGILMLTSDDYSDGYTDESFFEDLEKELQRNFKPKKSLSPKEERDIATDLERMIGELESREALAFHGEPMDDETKELMKISLENSLRLAKGMAKQKFNPNKNK
ncbi:hypothetical protein Back11_11350 [Paenibacillus baekrokdamisoli]|uniref:Uncharacterized protein n=1 Tax=Paenibacillus baekrokdamisoli TaxID=1712516 RepID=A0A3G9ILS9_9BACL|nr:helix-turn-helix transcriptional regulator [Paenibacillus baekrokdamisoli]MBB3070435.1 transcriptional regulator with XRE-family HTH domain [Paenibacillus baekrokdamisoli]BBH19790.1 hypothetical protein Back11_11350 [Paenibacillus baekrokdamisoli]